MRQGEALCIIVRRHQKEFDSLVIEELATASSKRQARQMAVRKLVGKYQKQYLILRGKSVKGRL